MLQGGTEESLVIKCQVRISYLCFRFRMEKSRQVLCIGRAINDIMTFSLKESKGTIVCQHITE